MPYVLYMEEDNPNLPLVNHELFLFHRPGMINLAYVLDERWEQ
jgi:hypothetical protein